ncbi:MAG: FAD-dependent oxidoreductase [Tepidisphaeraceae bacterium]
MLIAGATDRRSPRSVRIDCDLAIAGGGLAGTCCAITAARAGIKVTLIQDRPVLGGNASSEVRLWILGATSHMGNNNRWAREGGVVDEILVENMFRNPEGNSLILDTILLEKVSNEPNITLLLNTVVHDLEKADADTIKSLRAFCSQNSTAYEVHAPLFCDASGDGIVGFLSGAAFRMGAECRDEFGEKFAPSKEYGELLGHTIYFYTRDTGKPVRFHPPSYALTDITKIPRFRQFNTKDHGCKLWWIEYGGRLDTVHESETIKWELWRIVYGVWNHIKNSGEFPDAENLTLEWVGQIPGKRESRRFEGDYILRQQDVVEQRTHDDAVSFGGWSIDLHPADGVFSEKPGCNQWHPKGVYQIPYRTMYSRNIRNLFLAGRIISASHVAFGSSRVMATCAHNAQAVGMAAALCRTLTAYPRELAQGANLRTLQRDLLRAGQYIPEVALKDDQDLAHTATIQSSSRLRLSDLPADGPSLKLDHSWAMMIPVPAGAVPKVSFKVDVSEATSLRLELRTSSRPSNHTSDVTLAAKTFNLKTGANQVISANFDAKVTAPRYVFACLMANPAVSVRTSEQRITGILSVTNNFNPAVAKSSVQQPPEDIGVDTFEFWCPQRRPKGQNLAMSIEPPLEPFAANNVTGGVARPTSQPNAWVADPDDANPSISLKWAGLHLISKVELTFDTDYDHPAESVLMGHPETVMPFCVRNYKVRDCCGRVVGDVKDNHQTRNTLTFDPPIRTERLTFELEHPSGNVPASLFEVRCYGEVAAEPKV